MTFNPFEKVPEEAVAPFELSAAKFRTVDCIRRMGALPRINIAEAIDYSPSKVTSVVNDLVKAGILLETNEGKSSGGRRPREIAFSPNYGYVVAVTIGATNLDVALVDFGEHVRIRRMMPIDVKEGPDAILSSLSEFVYERLEQLEIALNKVYAFCITVPGSVETQTGTLSDTPIMSSWSGYHIERFIKESFPYSMVTVENDANAMAFGELRKGRGQGLENFIYLKVGRSIRAGIVVGGQIYRGTLGRAGDIGQTFTDVRNGSGSVQLDSLASGTAIAERALAVLETDADTILHDYFEAGVTAREVGLAASDGDKAAIEIVQDSGQIIGEALANLVTFLDPGLILIGGGVSNLGHQFLASVRRSILDRSPPVLTQHLQVEIAPLGSEASLLGATALALEGVFVLDE